MPGPNTWRPLFPMRAARRSPPSAPALATKYALWLGLLAATTGCLRYSQAVRAERTLKHWRTAQTCLNEKIEVDAIWLEAMVDGLFQMPDNPAATQVWHRCMTRIFEGLPAANRPVAKIELLEQVSAALTDRKRRRHVQGLEALRVVFERVPGFVDLRSRA
ncbi:MAG: hypothetical protein AAFV29_23680, partial [Myxococcota bacterium]